jgi:hypothetical protein
VYAVAGGEWEGDKVEGRKEARRAGGMNGLGVSDEEGEESWWILEQISDRVERLFIRRTCSMRRLTAEHEGEVYGALVFSCGLVEELSASCYGGENI